MELINQVNYRPKIIEENPYLPPEGNAIEVPPSLWKPLITKFLKYRTFYELVLGVHTLLVCF